jgi:hypothetical protein
VGYLEAEGEVGHRRHYGETVEGESEKLLP